MDPSEKTSGKRAQWQERSERPIATRPMTKAQIEEHRRNLVLSYKCDDEDITYDFEKIFDENDEDRDDCLLLIYKQACIWKGKPTRREIFRMKLPIPEELKMMAEQLKKQGAKMQRRRPPGSRAPAGVPALPAPGDVPEPGPHATSIVIEEITDAPAEPAVDTPPDNPEPQPSKPKLRKPLRKPTMVR